MKKILLGVLVLFAVALNAQTMKGTWMLGGNANFSSARPNVSGAKSTTTIGLNPNVGYFLINNLAVGASLGLTSYSSAGLSATQFAIGPFVRYYVVDLGPKAKLFGQGQFGYGSLKFEDEDAETNVGWGLGAGVAYFLNPSIALEGLLGYNSNKSNETNAVANNAFTFNVGFQIHFGGN